MDQLDGIRAFVSVEYEAWPCAAGAQILRVRSQRDGRLRAVQTAAAGEALAIRRLTRLPNDVFGKRSSYRETLDIRGEAANLERLIRLVDGMHDALIDVAHPDLSTTLFGKDVVFVEPDPNAAIRYQYLMRKNASYDHAAYLKRYREVHSQFGLRLEGIKGYVQFHVDPEASRALSQAAGFGAFGVDSVSELYLASVESFLEGVSGSPVGAQAINDEKQFVDRTNSVDFCSRLC